MIPSQFNDMNLAFIIGWMWMQKKCAIRKLWKKTLLDSGMCMTSRPFVARHVELLHASWIIDDVIVCQLLSLLCAEWDYCL